MPSQKIVEVAMLASYYGNIFKGGIQISMPGLTTVVWALIAQTLFAQETKFPAIPERSKYWPEDWTRHYSIGPVRAIVGKKTPLGVGLRTVDQRCVVTGVAQNGVAEKVRIAPVPRFASELHKLEYFTCQLCLL